MTPIAALLARIGWPSSELAGRLGVADATVRHWVSGRREPPPSVIERVALVADAVDAVWSLPVGWDGVRPGRRADAA